MDAEHFRMAINRDESWIFGYGSLMWRPDFPYAEKAAARLRGWMRRFWQASPDHRGVPDRPGRVVTLRRSARSSCWGMAYRLAPGSAAGVLAGLDYRERAGYQRRSEILHLDDGRRVCGLFYVAGAGNPNDLGPAPLSRIAEQVCRAAGPSGSNVDYVSRLDRALDELGVDDSHVAALARLVERNQRNGPHAPLRLT